MGSIRGVLGFCAALAGLVTFVACASSDDRSGFGNGSSSSGSGGDGGVFGGGNADGGPVDENGCSEAAKLVYVLSYEGDLYSFAPADKKFTKIGPLGCKLTDTQKPISM